MKIQLTGQKKPFANHVSGKKKINLIFRVYKEILELNNKKMYDSI